jgi:hypothetical protein
MFGPFIGDSAPPRRRDRVLPGQSTGGIPTAGGTSALRSLLAGRMGGEAEAGARRTQGVQGVPGGRVQRSVVVPGTEGARAAVGEFVSEMTGGGRARAPTEGEISV